MAIFKVSVKANQDLLKIGVYTQNKWGIAQRDKYLDEINDCFQFLADNPGLGYSCDDIRPSMVTLTDEFFAALSVYLLQSEVYTASPDKLVSFYH